VDEKPELTRIKGIGEARARWLADIFGARTAEELAQVEPDEIERRLKAAGGPGVSRRAIEGWVTEARALAANPEQEWKALASFVVDFEAPVNARAGEGGRTSVHHLEKDRTETWSGMEQERLCAWIFAQLPEPALEAAFADEDGSRAHAEDDRTAPPGPAAKTLNAELLVDGTGHGASPVPVDMGWSVAFEWSVEAERGLEADGEWCLDVLLQPLGAGAPVLRLRDAPVSVVARPGVESYRAHYEVVAGTVQASHCGVPYRAVAVLTYQSAASAHAHPAGFVQLGDLFFWHPSQGGSRPVGAGAVSRAPG
jgi:hypothetical protein